MTKRNLEILGVIVGIVAGLFVIKRETDNIVEKSIMKRNRA
jgi:hypothetical protein